jgi:sensor histidine kinase YesM
VEGTDLHLQVYNKKVTTKTQVHSTGIGIQNTKERLQLLYAAKHQLTIQDEINSYLVKLTITLT